MPQIFADTMPFQPPPIIKNEVIVHSFFIHSLQNVLLGACNGLGTNPIPNKQTNKQIKTTKEKRKQ